MDLHHFHSADKLQQIGEDLCRKKRYSEALEAFNAAAKAGQSTNVRLLNCRAATHEKLGDLQAALQDARNVLELDKTNVDAYLRTAKLLQKKEKPELALKILARGLQFCPKEASRHEVLRRAHDELSRTLAPPKSYDPFVVLPTELIEIIFRHMPFEDTCRCLCVSKHWQSFLKALPWFWIDLDFSNARKSVKFQAFSSYLLNSRFKVRRATLKRLDLQSSKILQRLTVKCKELEYLSIQSGGTLQDSLLSGLDNANALQTLILGVNVQITHVTLRKILQRCKSLSTIEVGSMSLRERSAESWTSDQCQMLKSISLHCSSDEPAGRYHARSVHLHHLCPPSKALTAFSLKKSEALELELGNVVEYLPNLKVLSLHNTAIVDHLYIQVGLNTLPDHHIELPSSIETLNLMWTGLMVWKQSRSTPTCTVSPSTDLPNLLELTVHENGTGPCPGRLNDLLQIKTCSLPPGSKSSMLRKVNIATDAFDLGDMTNFITNSRLQQLDELALRNSPQIDDDFVLNMADNWKTVTQLDLSGTKVTGVGVKKLVQSLPKLRALKLEYCGGVGLDAVNWAKSKGIRVSFGLAPTAKK